MSLSNLARWSVVNAELPATDKIKALHVYDFDNTLFKSPLPNVRLWNPHSIGKLQNQDSFLGGGWWHNARILEATGEGIEVEKNRAWEGWWNEEIVKLVRLSMQQTDALTVLLTGRGQRNFASLLMTMVASKSLTFDMICLKPQVGPHNERFVSTMQFKQALLQDLMQTYRLAQKLQLYEDRPRQTQGFREFLEKYNRNALQSRGATIESNVVQVSVQSTTLDPAIEIAEVQRMINTHNSAHARETHDGLELRRQTVYTAYMINENDTAKLLGLVQIPASSEYSDVNLMANSILIAPGMAKGHILDKVGGLGSHQVWQVSGLAFYQSSIWAARVSPVPLTSQVHTLNPTALIVLATQKYVRPEIARDIKIWQPVPADKQYVLHTTVGEKVHLRIEAEASGNDFGERKGRDRIVRGAQAARESIKANPSSRLGPRNHGTGFGVNGRARPSSLKREARQMGSGNRLGNGNAKSRASHQSYPKARE